MCVQHLHLETENLEKLCQPFVQALKDFMLFQQANSIAIERISHASENYSPVRLQQFQQILLSKL